MNLPLAVIGSGGTELDPLIVTDNDHFSTHYAESGWGFLTLKFDEKGLLISFMVVKGDGDYEMKYYGHILSV